MSCPLPIPFIIDTFGCFCMVNLGEYSIPYMDGMDMYGLDVQGFFFDMNTFDFQGLFSTAYFPRCRYSLCQSPDPPDRIVGLNHCSCMCCSRRV